MIFQAGLTSSGKGIWVNLETDCDSISEFLDKVRAAGILECTSLWTAPTDDPKVREIRKRDIIALSIAGIEWIKPSGMEFVEKSDA